MKSKSKLNKIYDILLKISIIVIAYGFIYKQIFYKEDLDKIICSFKSLFLSRFLIVQLLFIVFLMFINWGIEAWKWKFLIKKIEDVSFLKSIKAVLTGITVSTFTPNRIGEFFGRVFMLEKANRWQGTLITVIGSISQLMITIIIGLTGILFFIPRYVVFQQHFSSPFYYGIVVIVIGIIILLLFLFFNISFLTSFFNRLRLDKHNKFKEYVKVFSFYNKKELLKVLILSFIRYCVFSLQFYLLLILFKINIPFFEAIMIISVIYIVITAIPTIALSELGVRGSAAIYFAGMYFKKINMLTEQININIVTSTTALWIINLMIPALIGTLFVVNLKFFRKKV
jgi:uncharacterized membrane protein YbhN (UPF0104 family)